MNQSPGLWWAAWAVLLLLQAFALWLLWRRARPGAEEGGALQQRLLMGLQALDLRLQQIERGAQSTQMAVAKSDGAMERMAQQLQAHLAQVQADAQAGRSEQAQALGAFRQELSQLALRLGQEGSQARETAEQGRVQLSAHVQQRFEALAQTLRGTLDSLKSDVSQQLTHGTTTMGAALKDQLGSNGEQMRHQFAVLQDAVTQQLAGLSQSSQSGAEQLRATLNERLERIRSDNAQRLDEMRRTVDEKLHATLEQRLGESFKLVSDRLEQVHKGLGEMQTLAGSVGDLKRVMTNVKTRGTWGELQLGAIMENMLTPEQYAKNVKTVPGSDEMVEFAVRLPGKSDEAPVWLPIDAKYPVEAYQRLLDAQDAGDKAAMQAAGNAFESSIKLEAKKIYAKYVSPPHTTDFAVLYLPTEGLFAEVMRRPGLVEALHNECRVMMTGPANLAAMLSSLQMGFKTLAIEKRSSEVWAVLGQVKTEFAKFGEVVDATRKSIDAAARRFEQMGVRTRAIQRKLRDVQELPAPDPDDPLLGTGAPEDGEDGEG